MKISAPKHNVLECMALEMAGVWYEWARSSGLKPSRHKTARHFAAHNLEKFLPHAIAIAIDMLGRSDIPVLMKDQIHQAILERINDPVIAPTNGLPDIDISKIISVQDRARIAADALKHIVGKG